MSISIETLVSRKEIMTGRVLHVTVDTVEIDDGAGGEKQTATREAVWHRGACAILPVTDDGKLILVRQFRYAAGEPMLEVPAGKIEAEGESPDSCAERELEEETGYTSSSIKPLGFVYTSPGFCNERIYLYLATNLKKGHQHLDADEFMNLVYYTKEEVASLIQDNAIVDAKTIANFQKALPYLN